MVNCGLKTISIVKDFKIESDGKKARLSEIRLFTEIFGKTNPKFDDNIRQDLIREYKKFTLNFDSMSISLD
jgi:hypothetical protein